MPAMPIMPALLLLPLLLLGAALPAVRACDPAQPAASCSYGGLCSPSTLACECRPEWRGANCSQLSLLPAATGAAFSSPAANWSSWGGSVARARGRHYMALARMAGHCGLGAWEANSEVALAVSATGPEGPYSYLRTILPAFSHNPTLHTLANGSLLVAHIGLGVPEHPAITNCTSGSTPGAAAAAAAAPAPAQPQLTLGVRGTPLPPPNYLLLPSGDPEDGSAWVRLPSAGGGWADNNPALRLAPDDSALLVYKVACACPPPCVFCRQFGLATAPSWRGPFTDQGLLPVYGEDAYVWQDPAVAPGGGWHMLFQGGSYAPLYPQYNGHWHTAFSPNGLNNWTVAATSQVFDGGIDLAGGGSLQLSRRERHQVLFDAAGAPSHLFNGAMAAGQGSSDHTFTSVQPIAGGGGAGGGGAALGAGVAFAHPGVLVSGGELAAARARLAAGEEPTASFFRAAAASPQGSAAYVPHGPPANGTISCGYYDKPNIGCTDQDEDIDAAYTQALLYALGAPQALAASARAILNLYSYGLQRYTNNTQGTCCGNEALQAAWVGAKATRAAELLRHTPGSGWGDADSAAFSALMYRVHLPHLYNGTQANGNWQASFIEAQLGIAVFSENATLFDHAVAQWRARAPSYWYITSDGAAPPPNPQPNCKPQPVCEWYNQTVFNASVSGVCQETCRDMGHMQMGFAAFVNGASTASANGVDLLAEAAPRLLAGAEFAAGLLLGATPANSSLLCSGQGVQLDLMPTFEVAHGAFARLGLQDPATQQLLRTVVRPKTAAAQYGSQCSVWETLSHGLPLPPAAGQH